MTASDEERIVENFRAQQAAMVDGDTAALAALLSDEFTATHITGYEQPKREWLEQIKAGEFSYHAIVERSVQVSVTDDTAVLTATSGVTVKIGGGRGTWPLRTTTWYERRGGTWIAVRSASTIG